MGNMIREPEPCSVANLEPGQPFVTVDCLESGEPVRVMCKTRGETGDRGAANVAAVILAVEGEINAYDIGSVISLAWNLQVYQLELAVQPIYQRK